MPFDGVGAWHLDRPATLDRAIGAAKRAAPNLSSLADWLLPHLPKRTLASRNIRCTGTEHYSEDASLGYAITLPWFATDNETYSNAINIDADHDQLIERCEYLKQNFGIPLPVMVLDPWTGYGHASFQLAAPVHIGSAKANRYLRFAGTLIALALGATLMPRRALIKSPWGLAGNFGGERRRRTTEPCWIWQVHQASRSPLAWYTHPDDMQAIRLDDIVAALEPAYGVTARALRPPKQANAGREPSTLGRNCGLFDSVRFWAYNHHCSDAAAILAYASEINAATFREPLGHREVADVAKSIARYMATHDGRGRSRGRDARAGLGLTTAEKQTLSATKTSDAKRAKTDNAIATAWLKLTATGHKVTQAALAAASGFCLRTIKARGRSLPQRGAVRCPTQDIAPSAKDEKPALSGLPTDFGHETTSEVQKIALLPDFSGAENDTPKLGALPNLGEPVPNQFPTSTELATALHWLAKLALGPIPRTGTIDYTLATRMFALASISHTREVHRG